MRKITLIFCLLISFLVGAQIDINFDISDPAGPWLGYMNISEKDINGGAFIYDSGWGVSDLIVIENGGANTATFSPNRIGDTDPFWQTDGVFEGNKEMSADYYIDRGDLTTTAFNFLVNVSNFSLVSTGLSQAYTVELFIKVFDAGYANLLLDTRIPITAAGDYMVSYDGLTAGADRVQYGFNMTGVNINSRPEFDTQYANLGNVVLTQQTLSNEIFEVSPIKAYPNPTQNIWTIQAQSNIDNIQVFDVVGKQVMSFTPNSLSADIDSSALNNGIYLARISAGDRSSTIKLIKE